MDKKNYSFTELCQIIAQLRDPETGCPWDKEQTHVSLKPYLLEEAYEVIDAIDNHPDELKHELGDVLLQILLHSQIASESDNFDVHNVIDGLAAKLVRRHPHVFGKESLQSSSEVVARWEELKKEEKQERTGVLDGIPGSMPALARSDKIGRRVARVGFDWDSSKEVLQKVKEEFNELQEAIDSADTAHIEEELGDFLFTAAQLTRLLGHQAELALQRANHKFERRFQKLEEKAGEKIKELSLQEMHVIWDEIKAEE